MHALDGFRIGIRMEFLLGICPEIDRIEPKEPLCDKQSELAIAFDHSPIHFVILEIVAVEESSATFS